MLPTQGLSTSLGRLAALTRPQIAAQAAVYTFLGAFLSYGLIPQRLNVVALAALVTALIVSFGFVINDYADVEIDRLAKPQRPLPAGLWTRQAASRLAACLALSAAFVALTLPLALLVIALANLALAAAYSLLLKRTVLLGNVAIALLNSSIVIFGALAAGQVTALVWAVATMSLLYTLAQEVLYTVDDVDGDRAGGLVTTAVYFGVGPSLRLFRALMVLALSAALAPLLYVAPSLWYVAALAVCTIGPVLLHILPLVADGSPDGIRRACAAVKVVRVTSLLPLVLLRAMV